MSDDTYNGWTNRETWATKLHLDNTEAWQAMCQTLADEAQEQSSVHGLSASFLLGEALSAKIEDWFETVFLDPEEATKNHRMMASDVGSLWRVNWREIADNILED